MASSSLSPEECAAIEASINARLQSDQTWRALRAHLEPMYVSLGTTPGPRDMMITVYTATHNFLTSMGGLLGAERRGEWLYGQLGTMISNNLNLLTNRFSAEAPRTELEFMAFVQVAVREYHEKAKQAEKLLHHSKHWSRLENERKADGKRVGILELHKTLLQANLATNIQARVQATAFKFILNGGSLNCYPVIQGMATSHVDPSQVLMPTFSLQRRPMYLLTKELEQSASTRPRTKQSSPTIVVSPHLAGPQTSHRRELKTELAILMAALGHWALLILPPESSRDDSMLPARGSLLCELQRDKDGFVHVSDRTVEKDSFDGFTLAVHMGYTTWDDGQIREAADQAMTSMQRRYRTFSNNCQVFCKVLHMCIKSPDTVTELQSKYMELPYSFQDTVMCRRHIEHFLKIYEQISKGNAPPVLEFYKDEILPVRTLASWARLLVAATLIFACIQGQIYLRICVVFGILINLFDWEGLCGLRGYGAFEEPKWRPCGNDQDKFNAFISKNVEKFYFELEGETQRPPNLHGW